MVGQEGDMVHFAVRTDAQADLDRLLERGRPGRPAARAGVGQGGIGWERAAGRGS